MLIYCICLSVCLSVYQGSTLIHQKVAPPTEGQGSPVLSFIALEQFNAIRMVQVCQLTKALTHLLTVFTLFQKQLLLVLHIIIGLMYSNYYTSALLLLQFTFIFLKKAR